MIRRSLSRWKSAKGSRVRFTTARPCASAGTPASRAKPDSGRSLKRPFAPFIRQADLKKGWQSVGGEQMTWFWLGVAALSGFFARGFFQANQNLHKPLIEQLKPVIEQLEYRSSP